MEGQGKRAKPGQSGLWGGWGRGRVSYQRLASRSKRHCCQSRNQFPRQSVGVSAQRVTHLAPASLSVSQDLGWSYPPPPNPAMSSVASIPTSHPEGEFKRPIIYSIMFHQHTAHSLLICARLYVNYTPPSERTCVCGRAVFIRVECNLLVL